MFSILFIPPLSIFPPIFIHPPPSVFAPLFIPPSQDDADDHIG